MRQAAKQHKSSCQAVLFEGNLRGVTLCMCIALGLVCEGK